MTLALLSEHQQRMTQKEQGVFCAKLERVMERDDKARFVKLLQDHPSEITNSLLVKCPAFGARNCLLALLEGQVSSPPPALDLQTAKALAYVAHCFPEPRIIDLMLNHCNGIPFVNISSTIAFVDGYPIHFALVNLSYVEHLYPWSRGDSLIKLIFLLCQWKTKPILDCVRLLALYTDSINNIAWTFVKYGALKQFVALLLVAREKVMAPFDTGLTIREYITREIYSASECDSDSEEAEYKNMLIDASVLLDVFDRAGDSLSSYCISMLKYVSAEDGITNVCKLLRKAQVNVDTEDFDVYSNFKRRSFLKIGRYFKFAGTDYNCLSATPAGNLTHQYWRGTPPSIVPVWQPKRVPFTSQRMFFSTTAGHVEHVKRISKSWERAHVDPLLKHFACIAATLKKGLRFL